MICSEYQLPSYLEDLCERWALTGSRVICNPPPTDTDLDVLVEVLPKNQTVLEFELEENDWKLEGEYGNMTDFHSWRQGEVNIILTDTPIFFDKMMHATALCIEENVLVKADRIAVFDKVFDRKKEKKSKARTAYERLQATMLAQIQNIQPQVVFSQAASMEQSIQSYYHANNWLHTQAQNNANPYGLAQSVTTDYGTNW